MSKITLSIKYGDTQFKIAFLVNEKTIIGELKQFSVDRLSKLQKLVKIGFENIQLNIIFNITLPLNFEATNYLLKDNQNNILDDDDLVLDLIKDNEAIQLVFLHSLIDNIKQPQLTQLTQLKQFTPPIPLHSGQASNIQNQSTNQNQSNIQQNAQPILNVQIQNSSVDIEKQILNLPIKY